MSHLRNLFQKSVGHRHDDLPVAVEVPAQDANKSAQFRDIPVVEADVQHLDRIVCYTDPRGVGADRFRYLRMRLREQWNSGKLKKLLVTSPLAHEGKSTIVLNLATILSERGRSSVLVVEADFHHASLLDQLRVSSWPGLDQCLADCLDPMSSIRRVEPLGWYLLPAGGPTENASELLQSHALSAVMQRVIPHYDWILVDSPPVLPLTDALLLRQQTDASLLVVRAGRTPADCVAEAIELLGRQCIAGIVLNGAESSESRYSEYGYYYPKNGRENRRRDER